MARIVTIHQPDFAPWLGFFHRLHQADVFVVLDDAQFLRRGWHHRDKIKTANGSTWLTVPVVKKGRFQEPLNQVLLSPDSDWRRDHLETLRHNYRRASFFDALYPEIEALYRRQETGLANFNLSLIDWIARQLEIDCPTELASNFPSALGSTARLVELTSNVGGRCYLTGLGAKSYLDEGAFEAASLTLIWQEFEHPVYPQLNGAFLPQLSTLDYLFNCGPGNPFE